MVFATDFAEVRLPLTDLDLAFVDLPDAADMATSDDVVGPAVTLTAVQKGRAESWSARIVRTEGVVDENSRMTYAVARIRDPYSLHSDGNVLPVGTFVAAIIRGAAAENVIRVPRGVVRGSDELLFIGEDNKIRIRRVDIIRSDSEYSYLRGGASVGERIVGSALEAPINGMSVRTEDNSDAPAQLATAEDGVE